MVLSSGQLDACATRLMTDYFLARKKRSIYTQKFVTCNFEVVADTLRLSSFFEELHEAILQCVVCDLRLCFKLQLDVTETTQHFSSIAQGPQFVEWVCYSCAMNFAFLPLRICSGFIAKVNIKKGPKFSARNGDR